ncbi:ABC transporter ATP-binding protein [Salinibacterium sp. ZJ450]|uniref:ABC transporter ATP-binding protein n=1 Tax=Salinibacterium sp. ZJ450 TaxID=2708338 RepID=UPI0014225DF5|nr:ABC transporter ATP-binding protein [Salinibacterium sp. ZJ450]
MLTGDRTTDAPRLLSVEGLRTGYGRKQVVHDVGLHVAAGEIVGLMGHNGAGKTTLIRAVHGLLPVQGGRVLVDGADISRGSVADSIRLGLALIPSERFVFPDLNIRANLLLGAVNARRGTDRDAQLAFVEALFPILADRATQLAGSLSGGQQRMVSLGIALMAKPRLLLLDEPSLGLAPSVVEQIFGTLRRLADTGEMGILLLEQNVKQSLTICDRVYVMRSGSLILDTTAAEMRTRESYWDLF